MDWDDEIIVNSDEYVPPECGDIADKARYKARTLTGKKRFKFLKRAVKYGILGVDESVELMKEDWDDIVKKAKDAGYRAEIRE